MMRPYNDPREDDADLAFGACAVLGMAVICYALWRCFN